MKQQPNRREQHYYKSTPNHEAACEAASWLVEIFSEYEFGKLEKQYQSNHSIRIVQENASTDYAYLMHRDGRPCTILTAHILHQFSCRIISFSVEIDSNDYFDSPGANTGSSIFCLSGNRHSNRLECRFLNPLLFHFLR